MINILFLILFNAMMNVEDINMEKDKIKEGDCFTYYMESNSKKELCGFVVINIHKVAKKENIECALVIFNKEKVDNINDFSQGLLYSNVVYNPKKNILGIYCYEFHENTLETLRKFKYIGEVKVDKTKFMVGAGGDAPPEPKFSNLLLNARSILFAEYKQIPLKNILTDL